MFFLNSVRMAPGARSALAVACGLALYSAQVAWGDEALEPVVVTATRTATRVSNLVADVTVIDREQIEKASGQSLTTLLSSVPGAQMASNGGMGQTSSLFLRGGDANQTLLLIDGVPYNSGTTGAPSLDNIPLSEVDHIEIVKGPLATLYGSSAASGVVQIFTRKGRQGFTPSASVTLGSDRYYGVDAGFSGGEGRVTYSLHASTSGESGFSATNALNKYSYNPDRDGFLQNALTGSVGIKLNDAWRIDGNVISSKGVVYYDDGLATSGPTPNTNEDVSSMLAGLSLTGRIGADWQTTLKVAHTDDVLDSQVTLYGAYRLATHQHLLSWENHIATPIGQALVAFEQMHQDVDESPDGIPVTSRNIQSVVLGLSGSQGAHDWQVSARQDDNSQFGHELNGALGYGFRFLDDWRIAGSLGSSFVAPSFNDLYYPYGGDPYLKPQHGVNKDVSLQWAQDGHDVKLTRYDNRVRDYIYWGQNSSGASAVSNINGVRLAGWTLSSSVGRDTGWGHVFANGSLDWLDAYNVDTKVHLDRRVDRSASLKGGLERGPLTYELSVKGNGGSPDTKDTTHLAGYALWGASIRWAVAKNWTLGLRADNIGNHFYQTAWGYNQPLNRYFLSLSYTPK